MLSFQVPPSEVGCSILRPWIYIQNGFSPTSDLESGFFFPGCAQPLTLTLILFPDKNQVRLARSSDNGKLPLTRVVPHTKEPLTANSNLNSPSSIRNVDASSFPHSRLQSHSIAYMPTPTNTVIILIHSLYIVYDVYTSFSYPYNDLI